MKHNKTFLGIPSFAVIPLIVVLVVNFSVYLGARLLMQSATHYNITTKVDEMIPFLPWMVVIYLGCYAYWVVSYVGMSCLGKTHALSFYAADIVGKIVCFFCFIFFPTTMQRAALTGTDIFSWMTRIVYHVDEANNLFPSIHCFVSWLCYIGIRGNKKVPCIVRIASCIFAILVCISTVTLKQHVFVDIISGVLLAELSYTTVLTFYRKVIYNHKITIRKNTGGFL